MGLTVGRCRLAVCCCTEDAAYTIADMLYGYALEPRGLQVRVGGNNSTFIIHIVN